MSNTNEPHRQPPAQRWQSSPAQQWSGPPPGYPHPPAPSPRTNGLAIAALVMSVLFAPVGLVLAYLARPQIKPTGEGGWALTTAALIVGWIQFAPFMIALVWGALFLIGHVAGLGELLRPRGLTLGGSPQADEAAVAGVLTAVITMIVAIVLVIRAARKD